MGMIDYGMPTSASPATHSQRTHSLSQGFVLTFYLVLRISSAIFSASMYTELCG